MKKTFRESTPWSTKIWFFDRLSVKDRTVLFKHLATMIKAGVPLKAGLLAIHKQSRSKVFHRILHVIFRDLEVGENLSSSMKTMPNIFDPLVINLVAIGERTGSLADALVRISEHFEKSSRLKKKVIGALLYPFIVVIGTVGTVVYLIFVLLPQILPLFVTLNVELPWSTKFLINFSDLLRQNGLIILVLLVVLTIILFVLSRIKKAQYIFHLIIFRVPILGKLVRKTQVTRLSQMLGVLLKSGISIVEAFNIVAVSLENPVYKKAMTSIALSIQEGENIAAHLEDHYNLFSPLVTQIINIGEKTGSLDDSFFSVAEFTEEEIDDTIKILTTLLEPALMIIIGVIVGFVAISIITPIYQLTSSIGG